MGLSVGSTVLVDHVSRVNLTTRAGRRDPACLEEIATSVVPGLRLTTAIADRLDPVLATSERTHRVVQVALRVPTPRVMATSAAPDRRRTPAIDDRPDRVLVVSGRLHRVRRIVRRVPRWHEQTITAHATSVRAAHAAHAPVIERLAN